MKTQKYLLFLFVLLSLLTVNACTERLDQNNEADIQRQAQIYLAQTQVAQSSIETIVAQTITAISIEDLTNQRTPTAVIIPPTLTPTITLTLPPNADATLTPSPTNSPSSSIPMAEVSVPTNCRTGPGKIYDRVSVLDVNQKVEVIARNLHGTYWVVKNPRGSGYCWLWGNYATVTGRTADLPIWEAPPTPTLKAEISPTLTGVLLQVSNPTNCRVGPGKIYDKVSVLEPGKTVNVIARNASAEYWVIENPKGSGNCWVWGYYASVTGSTSSLPIWEPPHTPTPTNVTLKVSVDTNCRTGPGKPYDIITILRVGKVADVIARNSDETYWVIQNPSGSGQCWVWGRYAHITGNTANLPIWDRPPTPTPTPTKASGN